jgi:hypothetical protein
MLTKSLRNDIEDIKDTRDRLVLEKQDWERLEHQYKQKIQDLYKEKVQNSKLVRKTFILLSFYLFKLFYRYRKKLSLLEASKVSLRNLTMIILLLKGHVLKSLKFFKSKTQISNMRFYFHYL